MPEMILTELPREGTVRFSQITRILGFSSYTTLSKHLKDGTFPQPKIRNGHVRYFSVADIREWINGRRDWKTAQAADAPRQAKGKEKRGRQ